MPTAGSARTGAAIRNRTPDGCRWSRSADRAPRARAARQAAAWSMAPRPAKQDRAVRSVDWASLSGWHFVGTCFSRKPASRLPRPRSAHGKNGPNSLRRGLIFDVQSVAALGKLLFTLVARTLHWSAASVRDRLAPSKG